MGPMNHHRLRDRIWTGIESRLTIDVPRRRGPTMRLPKSIGILTILVLSLATSSAQAQTSSSTPPPAVEVTYAHPENFTEIRTSPLNEQSAIEGHLALLKRYIQRRATRVIAPGQQLSIVITDVALAGNYEPWPRAPHGWIRVVRRAYPPRIDLNFTLRDAHGKVLKEGKRKLTNPAFMDTAGLNDSDPLRYEKALINRWLRRGESGL